MVSGVGTPPVVQVDVAAVPGVTIIVQELAGFNELPQVLYAEGLVPPVQSTGMAILIPLIVAPDVFVSVIVRGLPVSAAFKLVFFTDNARLAGLAESPLVGVTTVE